jgi:hypothetical protein
METDTINRFNSVKIKAAALVFPLDKRGWLRSMDLNGGWFTQHTKCFLEANITAVVTYGPGAPNQSEDQEITSMFFVPRILMTNESYVDHKERLPLRTLDTVIASEVLADMTAIVARG